MKSAKAIRTAFFVMAMAAGALGLGGTREVGAAEAAGTAQSGNLLAGVKIGFVDFEKVFNNYKKTRDENQKLQRYKEEKEKSLQSFIDEVNNLKAEHEILSEEAKLKTEKNIKDKLRELRDYREDINQELLDKRNVVFQKITDEIRSVVEAKGKQDQFTLIMDDKALFYKESALDMTQSVIELLNDDAKRTEILSAAGKA